MTTDAPARAAARARGPNSGSVLWAWTTSAFRSAAAARTSSSSRPPRSSESAARARDVSAELRSSSACVMPARRRASTWSSTERSLASLQAVAVVDDEDAHAPGLRYPADGPAGALTVVVPTRGRAAYLEVTLDSLCRQRSETAHELLVVDDGATDATPEVAERFGVRLIRPRGAALAERGAEHGPPRGARRPDRVRGRRRAGAARLGGRAGGGRGAPPRGRGVRRPDPGALRGPRAARLRARGPADHDARPRRRGRGRRDGVGRELRGAAIGGGADRRVRREPRPRARRRGGVAAATARGRRADRLPGRGRASTTAAAPATPAWAHSRAPHTTAAAERARATAAAAPPPASPASCACWPGAAGTPSAEHAPRD